MYNRIQNGDILYTHWYSNFSWRNGLQSLFITKDTDLHAASVWKNQTRCIKALTIIYIYAILSAAIFTHAAHVHVSNTHLVKPIACSILTFSGTVKLAKTFVTLYTMFCPPRAPRYKNFCGDTWAAVILKVRLSDQKPVSGSDALFTTKVGSLMWLPQYASANCWMDGEGGESRDWGERGRETEVTVNYFMVNRCSVVQIRLCWCLVV